MDKDKDNGGGENWLWESGVGRAGKSNAGKMGTTVIEQFKKKESYCVGNKVLITY